MGGDSFSYASSSTETESSTEQDSPRESINCNSSVSRDAAEKQRLKVYAEVLRCYNEPQSRIFTLEEAKSRILSYNPGSWIENVKDLSEFDVPNTTSLLVIGLKVSGKSSLVNRISQVLEDDVSVSARAQVSCNSSSGNGTYFLHEYMIPKGSGSFCLYDTRSLSVDLSENSRMLKRWMTKGVRHGELVKRNSDSLDLRVKLKYKARRSCSSSQFRAIDFVIFVVNGVSVLESMDSIDVKKKEYSEMIAANFNNPLLSFKDDKPVVVFTHGDLLSTSDRVRVRVYLGELLGVPPTTQIFDIPENNDSDTKLAIVDMLVYCLERADRNLPAKDQFEDKNRNSLSLRVKNKVTPGFSSSSSYRKNRKFSKQDELEALWAVITLLIVLTIAIGYGIPFLHIGGASSK